MENKRLTINKVMQILNVRSHASRFYRSIDYNSEDTLSSKVVKGSVWVFSIKIFSRLLQLVRLLILARLLAPNDFGLFGIATLTLLTVETFSQTGFKQALIHKRNIEGYLNSAWTFSVIRGFILAGILYFIAPYVAAFFEVPEATGIIQIIGLSIIFLSIVNISVVMFQKELNFKKQFIYEASGVLFDFTVSVIAALILKNAWALVFGILAGNFVRFVVSYMIDGYRPRFEFDLSKIKELFGYGKWVFLSSALLFFILQGDSLIVGKVLGVTMLGFYQLAYKIANLPTTEISYVISQVTFPALSKLNHDIERVRKGFYRIFRVVSTITIPITMYIIVYASDFQRIVLGDKWVGIAIIIQLLAIAGLIRAFMACMGSVVYAAGFPKYDFRWQIVRLALFLITVFPLVNQFGINGVIYSVILSVSIGFLYSLIDVRLKLKISISKIIKEISIPAIVSLFMLGAILMTKILLGFGILGLTISLLSSLVVWLILYWIISKISDINTINDILKSLKDMRGTK